MTGEKFGGCVGWGIFLLCLMSIRFLATHRLSRFGLMTVARLLYQILVCCIGKPLWTGCWCCLPLLGLAQCPAGTQIREVKAEFQGPGLRQLWEFTAPDGSLERVELSRAYWLSETELLLWGFPQEESITLGLYMLRRTEQFGVVSWACTWRSSTSGSAVGDYRALVPVSDKSIGTQRLLAIDVQEEVSTGTILVEFENGHAERETYLPLMRWDADMQSWTAACPDVDSLGRVRFAPDIYRLGWGESERAFVGQELVFRSGADSVEAVPVVYQASSIKGIRYRLAPTGDIVLAEASKVPTGKRLTAFVAEVRERHGGAVRRILASGAVIQAAVLSVDDPERYREVLEGGVIWGE